MLTFMHQWSYKDPQVREFINQDDTRADVVRTAIEAFGGRMLGFYFCLGDHDGVAISEFPDEETALACVMLIFGQGRVRSVQTMMLFPPDSVLNSMQIARAVLNGGHPSTDGGS